MKKKIEELCDFIAKASVMLYGGIENNGLILTAELKDGRTIEIIIKEKE